MMCRSKTFLLFFLSFFILSAAFAQKEETPPKTIAELTKDCQKMPGYFSVFWNEKTGKMYLEVTKWEEEFLYVNSLTGGVGSNDIGLDRNQLGDQRIVKFIRSGPKVMLVQPNYNYRAITDNDEERQSVENAFAQSVLWGFKAEAVESNRVLIDLTPFLMADAHDVAGRLKTRGQGTYKIEASRSFLNLERTKNFPKNTEFDATITLTGDAKGSQIRSVTPTADIVTVAQHHSFVELPEPGFEKRDYDPRSGFYAHSFYDYATPIQASLTKRYIVRHRLEKQNPAAGISEAVEPIVYYLDPGVPEPIKSALIEGGAWWNEAFEAAGYRNAFQVRVLPEGADPMDVRYNVINWTHRSTRGWSYGSSVIDPRTGEIIKGHVLLGSLRVRQDFLIAQGLINAYENGTDPDPRMLEMALARLRQLSAHEIGHTLGLQHNFAASYNDRASVMDYPHPYIRIDANGEINFDQAYATGIGEWDKRTIIYGYQDFPESADEAAGLAQILAENEARGFLYMSDADARPVSGAHPTAHLWDNGQSAAEELRRLTIVRRKAMAGFGEQNIPVGAPMSTLEDVFVPLYLMHRYQVEGAAKVIGGLQYEYGVRKEENSPRVQIIPNDQQRDAFNVLLETLDPAFLAIPEHILQLIPPAAPGYNRGREHFNIHTGNTFDPLAAAESSANHTFVYLLNAQRLARLIEQPARKPYFLSAYEVLNTTRKALEQNITGSGNDLQRAIARVVEQRFVYHLIQLAADEKIQPQVAATALSTLIDMQEMLPERISKSPTNSPDRAHLRYLRERIDQFRRNPQNFEVPAAPKLPDGSPIGCGE